MKLTELEKAKKLAIGQRVRFYDSDFCRKAPDDLKPKWYHEGVVVTADHYMGAIQECVFKVDKLVMNGRSFPRSWKIGTEFRFLSDTHGIQVLSPQLFITF